MKLKCVIYWWSFSDKSNFKSYKKLMALSKDFGHNVIFRLPTVYPFRFKVLPTPLHCRKTSCTYYRFSDLPPALIRDWIGRPLDDKARRGRFKHQARKGKGVNLWRLFSEWPMAKALGSWGSLFNFALHGGRSMTKYIWWSKNAYFCPRSGSKIST